MQTGYKGCKANRLVPVFCFLAPPAAKDHDVLKAKEEELQRMKAKVQALEQQAKAEQASKKALEDEQRQQEQHQQQLKNRKARLNSAFGAAFANAAKTKSAESVQASTQQATTTEPAAADIAEVKRVLSSKGDYEVLQLLSGCSRAELKKRYKEMAVRLHPDKCSEEGATSAFQRVHKAYQNLNKFVA